MSACHFVQCRNTAKKDVKKGMSTTEVNKEDIIEQRETNIKPQIKKDTPNIDGNNYMKFEIGNVTQLIFDPSRKLIVYTSRSMWACFPQMI